MADTLSASHLPSTSRLGGGAAESAGDKKEAKYTDLAKTYTFMPIAFETLGPINSKALSFLGVLGRRITTVTEDSREGAFLLQRLSAAIQRFNSLCFKGSFVILSDQEG